MANIKIAVLGAKGMLGQMAVAYFKEAGYQVIAITDKFNPEAPHHFLERVESLQADVIINAIGKIKQKSDDLSSLLWTNLTLPLSLYSILKPHQLLIHPSTDCVFDGQNGYPYMIDYPPNAIDHYGWSKRLAEAALQEKKSVWIIRVSIIGPSQPMNEGKGLLQWYLSQPETALLNGYRDHVWNGITTLEWCNQVHRMLNPFGKGEVQEFQFIQMGTEHSCTKYDLLVEFNRAFGREMAINPVITGNPVNRVLVPEVVAPSIQKQLNDLVAWMRNKSFIY